MSGSTDFPGHGMIINSNQNIGMVHISSQKSKNEFPDILIQNNNNSDLKGGNMSPVMH
jgi:hypothetical protein